MRPHDTRLWLTVGIVVILTTVWLLAVAAPRARGAELVTVGVGVEATSGGPVSATGRLPRPAVVRVAPKPVLRVIAAYRPSTAGGASWYCSAARHSACTVGHPGGHYAAAGPKLRALLGPGYVGRTVTVSSGGRSTEVVVIDWCGCPDGRVLDLYADAFDDLADLGRGVIDVVVSR